MAAITHSFGPTCALFEEPEHAGDEGHPRPHVKAQFFYVSSLPIDDPLSPLPPISADKAVNLPPQPFSIRDNAALEEAWTAFQKEGHARGGSQNPRGISAFQKFRNASSSSSVRSPSSEGRGRDISQGFNKWPRRKQRKSESQVMLDENQDSRATSPKPVDAEELQCEDPVHQQRPLEEPRASHRRFSPFRHRSKSKDRKASKEPTPKSDIPELSTSVASATLAGTSSDISGRPFARAPSARNISSEFRNTTGYLTASSDDSADESQAENSRSRSRDRQRHSKSKDKQKKIFVPVGVSRLHLVEMPTLVMKPIYWSPINDTSNVIRATWFYKDTMLPIPADVANRLEIGYEYMMPYADHYHEELQACIDNGAVAELKVVHRLWPDESTFSRPPTAVDLKPRQTAIDVPGSSDSHMPKAAMNVAVDPRRSRDKRLFSTHSVVYVDARNAQILRPSSLPSERQNRRPLNSIRKGRQIGVAVVRGFDRQAWLKIHPDPKLNAKSAHAKVGAYLSQSGDATTRGRRMSCAACEEDFKTPKVADLVLVIHGIGQKLSERVDSFHFTHAINNLRREFNVESSTEAVKGNLKDHCGIMVLPVNWRLTVSFDEENKTSDASPNNQYQLKDITPDSLQGVRSLISDVMLDIPYYLSHHKEKMTSAVIREANRVYRLWCRNNPGFEEHGRVHLIAHSLGSVMAMEILSRQPTRLTKDMKFDTHMPSEKMFEFDTTNLFSCGSPSGFFLLLNNASLVPRKGRAKPGMELEDRQPGIAFEAQYGCLAVDNIYNICHRNDPISYLQNASVDQLYSTTLVPAVIPTTGVGLMTRISNTLRWASNPGSDAYTASGSNATRPELTQMPSTVEMDTHNFTREEVAEKRMYLLNENGQIDWFLESGGGPLEIQYLNMLSAHSSYWVLRDFVRFLVVEIGRRPGKENTLPVLRARKQREFRRGSLA
ncbi:uncharacterized protein A1O9_08313 [Exophiala aquamarina CBS 119918]|uniref:DDHD domain-containing protein n=1 Tax=Exophiala aquamarina CBS 119918 TaxID=1182545 RepID=A0A072P8E7_9EURO|nr:uncharacterized protein A1O9_08313 [Exophiala aquamarina CBS 119918]KEF55563.1 hypothetical protein A1O9_08313 [Exophiala aquamarina CBS 119918]